jgi:hypothetical protein
LLNKAVGIAINDLYYYRVLKQLTIVVKIALKLWRHTYSLFARCPHIIDPYSQKILSHWYIKKEIIKIDIESRPFWQLTYKT